MSNPRRKFMGQMLAGAGGLLLPAMRPIKGFADTSSGQYKRRHLINLIGAGGWDTSWFHNTFSQQALANVDGAWASQEVGGFEYEKNGAAYKYTQKCTDAGEAQMGYHPNDRNVRLGPGMKWIFQDSDYNDFLIWNGLIPAGSHEFGNNLILQGNSSTYALSFSSLISQALAEIDPRPLHYVLMADAPTTLFTNFALAKSFGVPICIPDISQFQQLTVIDPADLQDPSVRAFLNTAVQRLTSEIMSTTVKTAASKSALSGFRASFDGANQIYGSDFTSKPEFKYLYKRYILAMGRAITQMSRDPAYTIRGSTFPIWFSGGDERFGPNWIQYYGSYTSVITKMAADAAALAPLPAYAAFMLNPSAYLAGIADVDSLTGGFWAPTSLHAYRFALADYLVRNNLSAVVDLPAWVGIRGGVNSQDMHVAYMEEILNVARTFAGFKALIASLKEVPLLQGGTLFDCTMIALHSEFDRNTYHNGKAFNQVGQQLHVGTNHGETASVILAGYGINKGRVIGGMHQGPLVHSAYSQGYPDGNYYLRPLPIDIMTGALKPTGSGGKRVSTLGIFPTVMAAFGVEIPVQQITDWEAIKAILKT